MALFCFVLALEDCVFPRCLAPDVLFQITPGCIGLQSKNDIVSHVPGTHASHLTVVTKTEDNKFVCLTGEKSNLTEYFRVVD